MLSHNRASPLCVFSLSLEFQKTKTKDRDTNQTTPQDHKNRQLVRSKSKGKGYVPDQRKKRLYWRLKRFFRKMETETLGQGL